MQWFDLLTIIWNVFLLIILLQKNSAALIRPLFDVKRISMRQKLIFKLIFSTLNLKERRVLFINDRIFMIFFFFVLSTFIAEKNNIRKNFIRYDFKFDANIVMNILFAISNYIFFTFITRMINVGNDSNGMQWIYLKGFNKRPLFLFCYFLFSVWKDMTKNLLFLKRNVCICKESY